MKETLEIFITDKILQVHPGVKAGVVLELLKTNTYDYTHHVFVTNNDNKFIGVIDINSLLKQNPDLLIDDLIEKCDDIGVSKSPGFAVNYALNRGIQFVPVADKNGIFIGILPPKTIVETLRREHVEDMHRMAGIKKEAVNASKAITEPPTRSVWHRLPWLLVGLIGSFLATFIMSSYEETLNSNIALAFFIPGIVYLADAIGTQTETIVIRGLSLSWTSFKKILRREFITGFLIGLILGLISLPVIILGGFEPMIAVVVAISITVAGTLSTTIGLLLPWLILRLGKDPAFGSGPLATIIQDVLSILVYLLVATTMLSLV